MAGIKANRRIEEADAAYIRMREFVFSYSGPIPTFIGAMRYYVRDNFTITEVFVSVGVAPGSGPLTLDINRSTGGGALTTIFTTQGNRPSIAAGANSATAVPDVTTLLAGDYITLDVDVTSLPQPQDLVATIIAKRT